MEHSQLDNHFVQAIESLFTKKGPFYKSRLVWAGDYADPETDGENLQHASESVEVFGQPPLENTHEQRYIVNHDTHEYIDKWTSKELHPLPLLTAEGNGLGIGDYCGLSEDKIGIWARNILSIEKDIPLAQEEVHILFSET